MKLLDILCIFHFKIKRTFFPMKFIHFRQKKVIDKFEEIVGYLENDSHLLKKSLGTNFSFYADCKEQVKITF